MVPQDSIFAGIQTGQRDKGTVCADITSIWHILKPISDKKKKRLKLSCQAVAFRDYEIFCSEDKPII